MTHAARTPLLLLVAALVGVAAVAGEPPVRLELVAPGRAGSADQAQPTMDAFAAAIAAAAGQPASAFSGHYTNDLETGLARLRGAERTLAFVPFEFYLRYRDELRLEPFLAIADANGVGQRWHLVAGTGRLSKPDSLAGGSLAGLVGYTPDVVRHVLLAEWGALPEDVTIRSSPRILGDLRAAARDGSVVLLLDAAQHDALGRLPFAAELEVVTSTASWPSNLVCLVGEPLDAERLDAVRRALLGLHDRDDGRAALDEMRQDRFLPLERIESSLELGRRLLDARGIAERSGAR